MGSERGGWGGTPSAARLLDFWIAVRGIFGVFPLNQDRPGRMSARLAPRRMSCLADGARGGVSFGHFKAPIFFVEERLDEKNSNRKSGCRVARCGRACGDDLRPREKRQPGAAQNHAL